MKKSFLFGVLAFFAVSALSIQDANAQNDDAKAKKAETTAVSAKTDQEKAAPVAQEPVKQKKDDCCTDKNVNAEKKKGDCCEKASDDQKKIKAEGRKPKADAKRMKHGEKKARKSDAVKPGRKGRKDKATTDDKTDK